MQKTPSLSFVLREFHLRGNTVLSAQQIQALTDPYIGKAMTERELAQLMAALRKRYEDKGYTLVGLGFPMQDVTKGALTVEVVEPRLARVEPPSGDDIPLPGSRVPSLLSYFDVHAGGLLNTASLERVMFTLNDTPGVQAKATLTPAGDEGVYNLAIETHPRRGWDASVSVDNHGIDYAGEWRATSMLRLNNPLGIGDNLDLQALLSNTSDVRVGRAAYEVPVLHTPARFSLAYAEVAYSLGGDFDYLDAHGAARVVEANLSYPLIRSRTRTLMLRLGGESKRLTDRYDDLDGTPMRADKRVSNTVAGLNFESRDGFLGGGFNGASLSYYLGTLRHKSQAEREQDAVLGGYGTGGQFGKLNAQYTRLQALTRTLSLSASVSHQLASRNLDSAEKMSLGGPRGVRAYATAEGASDDATLLNTELRYWISPNWTVFALYDWARGRKVHDLPAEFLEGNDFVIRGAGLGLVATFPRWATVKATIAWRGERAPLVDPDHAKARFFLQAQHTF